MCFATMALIAGVGGAISAGGMLEKGAADSNASNYRAQIADNNAKIAQQNSDYSIAAGQQTAQTTSLKGANVAGRIKTAQAASGVDVNSGSAVKVQQSQREAEKLDTETVLNNAELSAYGYRVQKSNFTAEAGLDRTAADQATTGAAIGATGSLLSSASGVGMKWTAATGANTNPFSGPSGGTDYAGLGGWA